MLSSTTKSAVAAVAQTRVPRALQSLLAPLNRSLSSEPSSDVETFAVQPGSLLHVLCTHPHTDVHIGNKAGHEETVSLQAECSSRHSCLQDRFLVQQLPGGRIIDVVEHAASSSSSSSSSSTTDSQQQQQQPAGSAVLAGTIPSRFCGLSVTTAGGSVTVGQLQEADMHLSTAGGDVKVTRCRAINASIRTAAAGQQADPAASPVQLCGGEVQVGELSASRASVYSGGGAVAIKRLFGLTVDVLSAGGPVSIGSVYADRAAVSTAGPAGTAAAAGGGAASSPGAGAGIGQRAAAAAAAAAGGSGGRLHVGHIACLKGEARLESGGGALEVDGLEGNAALLSSGGDIKVHLHEQAGLVYVDSGGGTVTAWVSPAGSPLGLQVKAAGGVDLDPALKVTGELGPTMLFGVTSGDGTMGSMSSRTSAMVQEAVAAAHSSAGAGQVAFSSGSSSGSTGSSSRGCWSASEGARWQQNAQQVAAWSQQAAAEAAAAAEAGGGCCKGAAGGGCSDAAGAAPRATRQLVINAGWGRVELKAMGWMEGLKARMQAKQSAEA